MSRVEEGISFIAEDFQHEIGAVTREKSLTNMRHRHEYDHRVHPLKWIQEQKFKKKSKGSGKVHLVGLSSTDPVRLTGSFETRDRKQAPAHTDLCVYGQG